MAPANESASFIPVTNVHIDDNLALTNTTLKTVAADNDDLLNVVLVPVLVMAVMISIAAIVMLNFDDLFNFVGFSNTF